MQWEFDCVECKRHIIRFVEPDGSPALCAECLCLPGWFETPLIRGLLDPEMEEPPVRIPD